MTGLNIILFDHNLAGSGWRETLSDLFKPYNPEIMSFSNDTLSAKNLELVSAKELRSSKTIIFAHSSGRVNDWIKHLDGIKFTGYLVLVHTSGCSIAPQISRPWLHNCVWSPLDFISRPEPRNFVRFFAAGLTPQWALLERQLFPSTLAACCWIIPLKTMPIAAKHTFLKRHWDCALHEYHQLSGDPSSLDFVDTSTHELLRDLLENTWQYWGIDNDVLLKRHTLSHSWCESIARGHYTFKAVRQCMDDLAYLANNLHTGYLTGFYDNHILFPALSEFTPDILSSLVIESNQLVLKRYPLNTYAKSISRIVEKIVDSNIISDHGDILPLHRKKFLPDARKICAVITKLPKGIPFP